MSFVREVQHELSRDDVEVGGWLDVVVETDVAFFVVCLVVATCEGSVSMPLDGRYGYLYVCHDAVRLDDGFRLRARLAVDDVEEEFASANLVLSGWHGRDIVTDEEVRNLCY